MPVLNQNPTAVVLKFNFHPFKKSKVEAHRLHQQDAEGAGSVRYSQLYFYAEIHADFLNIYYIPRSFKRLFRFFLLIFFSEVQNPMGNH